MSESTLSEFVERKDFLDRTSIDIPDLIEIQKRSYEEFLQMEVEPDRRKDHRVAGGVSQRLPITDYNNNCGVGVFPTICWELPSTMSGNVLSRNDLAVP